MCYGVSGSYFFFANRFLAKFLGQRSHFRTEGARPNSRYVGLLEVGCGIVRLIFVGVASGSDPPPQNLRRFARGEPAVRGGVLVGISTPYPEIILSARRTIPRKGRRQHSSLDLAIEFLPE